MSTTELKDGPAVGLGPGAGARVIAPSPGEAARFKPLLAWYAVTMVALVTVFGQIDYGIMSLLAGSIKKDLHLGDTQLSLLMGIAYAGAYMCAGIPMARLTDVKRRTFILSGALAVWSIGAALCGLARNFGQFFLFRAITGGGVSVKGPTSVSIIPDLVVKEKLPTAFGIYNIAVNGGQSLSLIIGGLVLGAFVRHAPVQLPGVGVLHPWQMVFLLMGIPGVLFALFFVLTVPEPARHGRKRQGSAPVKEVAKFLFWSRTARVFIPIILGTALSGIYAAGIGQWRPVFFERTYGFPAHEYGKLMGSITLISNPLAILLGAFIAERLARRAYDAHIRLVVIMHFLMIPLAVMSPLMPSWQLAMGVQVLSMAMLMMSAPSSLAAMQIITPNEMRGQVNAVYMLTISVIGNAAGPTVVALTEGFFHGDSALRYAMAASAAVATPLTLFCLWWARKPYGELHREIVEAEQGARPAPTR